MAKSTALSCVFSFSLRIPTFIVVVSSLHTNSDSLFPPFCTGWTLGMSLHFHPHFHPDYRAISPRKCFHKALQAHQPDASQRAALQTAGEQGCCCWWVTFFTITQSPLASLVAAMIYSGLAVCQEWVRGLGPVARTGLTLKRAILTTHISFLKNSSTSTVTLQLESQHAHIQQIAKKGMPKTKAHNKNQCSLSKGLSEGRIVAIKKLWEKQRH